MLIQPLTESIKRIEENANEMASEIENLKQQCSNLESINQELAIRIGEDHSKLISTEDRSRRNNNIFHGIFKQKDENTRVVLKIL